MFKHPKYYKELRDAGNELAPASAVKEDLTSSGSSPARNKSDQVISGVVFSSRAAGTRAPGPGLKLQATSFKHQASSFRTNLFKHQAASVKPLAASVKLKPASVKLHDA